MKPSKKAMSDKEAQNEAWNRVTGDLDGIEAAGMFNESNPMTSPEEGTKLEAHGVSVHLKPMAGTQTKDTPKIEDEDEEADELGKLGL